MSEHTWKSEAIEALKELGGIGHIKDILDRIIKRNNLDITNAKTPGRTLSRTLQTYSFSTDYGIENIFYCVYGVEARKGIWALVDYSPETMECIMTCYDDSFSEGSKNVRQHIFRERNPKLIKAAKQKFKDEHNGRLYCEICGFDFSEKYGALGDGFIEAHHIKPISEMTEGERTKIEDIVMLCSNCHRMIHRRKPWLRKDELKTLLSEK